MRNTAKPLVAVREGERESNNLKEIIVVIKVIEKIKEINKDSLMYRKIRKKLILLYDSLSFL